MSGIRNGRSGIRRPGPVVPSGPPPPFSNWQFSHRFNGVDGATTFSNDEIGGLALTASGTGSALTTATVLEGTSSLTLTGAGQVSITSSSAFVFAASTPFTVACKFRTPAVAALQVLLSRWRLAAFKSWHLQITAAGALRFMMSAAGTLDSYILNSADGVVLPDTNYEVMVDRDASNNVRIYLNGVMVAKSTTAITSFDSAMVFWIGGDRASDGSALDRFTGIVDDVRISNVAAACGSDAGYTP